MGLAVYSVWSGWWLWVTYLPVGDGGVTAHLWLTITGFPSAFLSWLLPHGSLSAVAVAGVLGAIQLIALIYYPNARP